MFEKYNFANAKWNTQLLNNSNNKHTKERPKQQVVCNQNKKLIIAQYILISVYKHFCYAWRCAIVVERNKYKSSAVPSHPFPNKELRILDYNADDIIQCTSGRSHSHRTMSLFVHLLFFIHHQLNEEDILLLLQPVEANVQNVTRNCLVR